VPDRAIASTGFAVIRANLDRVIPNYLYTLLRSSFAVDQMVRLMGKGAYPSINQADVSNLRIPLPPLEIQNEIVAEIETYQKVIDGARAVVENYRPHIPIDPTWLIRKLEEVAEIIMGQSPPGHSYNKYGLGAPLINGPVEFGPEPFSKTKVIQYTSAPTKLCKKGDLILCVRGATTGRINLAGYDGCIGRGVAAIRATESQEWLNFVINSLRDHIYKLGTGSTFPNISYKDIASLQIPMPPFQIQQEIISEIETEQAAVDANYRLIISFEKKIEATINKIWRD
jgi:restriction endonuclease S subunit